MRQPRQALRLAGFTSRINVIDFIYRASPGFFVALVS